MTVDELYGLVLKAHYKVATVVGTQVRLDFVFPIANYAAFDSELSIRSSFQHNLNDANDGPELRGVLYGFARQIDYFLKDATYIDVPLYAFDVETGERTQISTQRYKLERFRLVVATRIEWPQSGTPYLKFC